MTRTAEQELRRHARERHRRASVRAQDMEAAMTRVRDDAEPRMSHEQWVESCLLTRGVDARLWPVLELYWCGWDDSAPAKQREELVLVTMRGKNVMQEIACAVSFQEAAARAGVSHAQARKWWRAALELVAENQGARRARGHG